MYRYDGIKNIQAEAQLNNININIFGFFFCWKVKILFENLQEYREVNKDEILYTPSYLEIHKIRKLILEKKFSIFFYEMNH
ncbi:hypothetical protein RIR_jg8387.t1 [Rhizophagus irregularis DAOM 181602=DAOM 197198]|nr:hypothetical protein RIR_jg8387.t1 [Rhizophagus irregularis DAOM 181602=DAOM 197198]